MRKLERRIGAPLFERTSRVVRPHPDRRPPGRGDAPLVPASRRRSSGPWTPARAHRRAAGGVRRRVDSSVLLRAVSLFTERHPTARCTCTRHLWPAPGRACGTAR
ncbi:LysR family transcriptional regulator [Micromonospora sp. WMMB482]|uniref:helix-turn-helix domain-containing protein n=1 Tax=Micromonospora sp. WMMB482 TaxID=2849653 RepID=UPI0035B13FB7